MRIPTLVAGLTAPLVGIVVAAAIVPISDRSSGEAWARTATEIGRGFVFFAMFGAPGAYLLEVLLGRAAYLWMQRRGAITVGPLLVAGVVGGILATLLPSVLMGAGFSFGPLAIVGAAGGLAAAVWFWLVSRWGHRAEAATGEV